MRTFDIHECAEFLKVDESTACKMAASGELPGAKIGRAWVFLEDELTEYLRLQIRRQMRERATGDQLHNRAVLGQNGAMTGPRPKRTKRGLPDLSAYPDVMPLPELVRQV